LDEDTDVVLEEEEELGFRICMYPRRNPHPHPPHRHREIYEPRQLAPLIMVSSSSFSFEPSSERSSSESSSSERSSSPHGRTGLLPCERSNRQRDRGLPVHACFLAAVCLGMAFTMHDGNLHGHRLAAQAQSRMCGHLSRGFRRFRMHSPTSCAHNSCGATRATRENGKLHRTNPDSVSKKLGENAEQYKEELNRAGAVRVPGFFNNTQIERLREECMRIVMSGNGVQVGNAVEPTTDTDGPKFLQLTLNARISEVVRHFICESDISALAAIMMDAPGLEVAYHSDDIFVKQAGCQEKTLWHRDTYSETFSQSRMVNVWIPLGYLGKEQCIRVLRGSHTWENRGESSSQLELTARSLIGKSWRDRLRCELPVSEEMSDREINGLVDSFAIELIEELLGSEEFEATFPTLKWDCAEGDAIIFHRQALHSAHGNPGRKDRVALSVRWGLVERPEMTTNPRYDQ